MSVVASKAWAREWHLHEPGTFETLDETMEMVRGTEGEEGQTESGPCEGTVCLVEWLGKTSALRAEQALVNCGVQACA